MLYVLYCAGVGFVIGKLVGFVDNLEGSFVLSMCLGSPLLQSFYSTRCFPVARNLTVFQNYCKCEYILRL
jgi:hypothetical protein